MTDATENSSLPLLLAISGAVLLVAVGGWYLLEQEPPAPASAESAPPELTGTLAGTASLEETPAAETAIRTELRPRGFMLVLIGKDGFKYLRKPLPWDVREITRSIDKMPLRQQEIRDRRGDS